jgi:hypothetical protein
MAKTKYCDECRFFSYPTEESVECSKGHRPRFYKPKTQWSADWGYKRRCDDFILGDHVHVINLGADNGKK